MMKNKHTGNPDEMQEQKILKTEEYGFWILFWALAAAIAVQLAAGSAFREVIGELAVLLIGSLYVTVTLLKNGLWTRTSTPSRKGNAVAGILAAVLIGAVNAVGMIRNNTFNTHSVLITVAIMAAAFVLCFGLLELFRFTYSKRRAELDDIDEKESGEK